MPQVRSGYPTSIIQFKEPNKRKKAQKKEVYSVGKKNIVTYLTPQVCLKLKVKWKAQGMHI